ncbi:MAG: AAA family ATPase [Patescibacteria group bacterium]
MDQNNKNILLKDAKKHVKNVRLDIDGEIKEVKKKIIKNESTLRSRPPASQQLVLTALLKQQNMFFDQLNQLYPSPYFVRCDVEFDDTKKQKVIYFAKFGFSKDSIYSWIAPAAVIRFEEPGKFIYKVPGEKTRSGKLLRKDQFMVVNGKIVFMATESLEEKRTLVHQKGLTRKKTEFVLPEIVEVMEKTQDEVIRAHHKGPFLIAGPAGSGKTTLALHRVAYLVQSPDLAEQFRPEKIIVFVQDISTKKYFDSLLPDLGINNVKITTFAEWALNILRLKGIQFIARYGNSEKEKDLYEHSKFNALANIKELSYSKNIFEDLEKLYFPCFSGQQRNLFNQQKKDKVVDRFDLTILLKAWVDVFGGFEIEHIKYEQTKNWQTRRKITKVPLKYSLIIIDEAENYLTEQIKFFNSLINEKTGALLFVGDLAQQSFLHTIKDWEDIGYDLRSDRKVTLEKIYRSTKQILEYIKSLGYRVEVPKGIKEGNVVKEIKCNNIEEEIKYINKIIENNKKSIVGVLAKKQDYLNSFEREFDKQKNIKVLTINEAQGVEFDIVCLVGMGKDFFIKYSETTDYSEELMKERNNTDKDLLYLALTRAMNELHVLGKESIKNLL